MIYIFYLSVGAALSCIAILVILKFVAISKMRIDNRDKRRNVRMTAMEVLMLMKNMKPFPVGIHKGWKLHSFINDTQVWGQEVSLDSSDTSIDIYGAFGKVRIPPQMLLQILKDVSKTSSWKPGRLATSITYKPPTDSDLGVPGGGRGSRAAMMVSGPVHHDVVMEESSWCCGEEDWNQGLVQLVLSSVSLVQNGTLQTVKKELKRYWHREDNGVCWHLQMCEHDQEWLFFLAQPVEDMESCLLTVIGHSDKSSHHKSAKYISEITSSLSQYILYRKLPCTPLVDIKLPTAKPDRHHTSYSSSDDGDYRPNNSGKGLYQRFRSMVEKPSFGADRLNSIKGKMMRSASILHHKSPPFSDLLNGSGAPSNSNRFKTSSLDRRDMPDLSACRDGRNTNQNNESESNPPSWESISEHRADVDEELPSGGTQDNNNDKISDNEDSQKSNPADDTSLNSSILDHESESRDGDTPSGGRNMDKDLEEDIRDQERYENIADQLQNISGSREEIKTVVTANQAAAELLAVALQASNLDLSKSVEEQVVTSGGWMFCGLDNDVVVLKKISLKENLQCYLGKGIIQATPASVWKAIKNPRTRFTYDDSLKKVDVLETIGETIKVVYYYHEVLQLFKTESYDMIVTQSERTDREDKHVLAMQSTERKQVASPSGALRVKVLPSGWIVEPVNKDKKVYSMVTYIMQIDFGSNRRMQDRTPNEDLISKQPMSIAYLRQYLKGVTYLK